VDRIPGFLLDTIPLSVCLENRLVPVDEIGNTLVVASAEPLPPDMLEKLQFIMNRYVRNVVVPSEEFERLLKDYEERSFENML
jgi:hypothetical protein